MKEEKIKRFMSDPTMSSAVYDVLMETFMKASTSSDVYTLASERLAINKLQDGWKELLKRKQKAEQEVKEQKQVAL